MEVKLVVVFCEGRGATCAAVVVVGRVTPTEFLYQSSRGQSDLDHPLPQVSVGRGIVCGRGVGGR